MSFGIWVKLLVTIQLFNISAKRVYKILRTYTNVLDYYIIPCYESLYTQSKTYIVDNLIEVLKEKGVVI